MSPPQGGGQGGWENCPGFFMGLGKLLGGENLEKLKKFKFFAALFDFHDDQHKENRGFVKWFSR
jgi:hypothetical protein